MPASTVSVKRLSAAAMLAACASAVLNLGIWGIGAAVGGMTVGWREVVLFSALGAVAGGVAFVVLLRRSSRPRRHFAILAIAVLAVYALGPVSAVYAPYMEGAERFNAATVIATELMHLVSGAVVFYSLTRAVTG